MRDPNADEPPAPPFRFESGLLARNAGFRAFLDHARWIASLTVVVGHARHTLMVPYADIADPGPLTVVFYFLTNFHFEAVMIFFALSGFLVGGMAIEVFRAGRFDAGRYFTNRLVRLYLPLIPVLALSALAGAVIAATAADGGAYGALEPGKVALHAVFLHQILTPTMPVNISLWSLTNEFWYYLMFGALLTALHARTHEGKSPLVPVIVLAAALVFLVAADEWDVGGVLLYMPMWLIGIAAWLKLPFRIPLAVSTLALLGALLLSRAHLIDDTFALRDFLIALGFIAVMMSLKDRSGGDAGRPTFTDRLGATLAGFSYSLYLVHFPIVVLAAKVVRPMFERTGPLHPTDPAAYPFVLGTITACAVTGYCFYWLTERHTGVVRARLHGALARRR